MEKNNVVRYHNDLNAITFYRFGSIDFDLFMSICSRMADQGEAEIVIGFDDLKEMSGFNTHWSEKRFIEMLDDMGGKQLLSQGRIQKENKITRFQLFPEMTIDGDQRILTVKANEKNLYILNDLKKNFTRFELQEFISLDSKYAKILYRLLKQYRTTGTYMVSLEELKRLMSVPDKYTNKYIQDKIIKPSIKALSKYFRDLQCSTMYERKPGRPVKGYQFTFVPEDVTKQIQDRKPKKPANQFHNFEQRTYDYDELERQLLEGKRSE